LTRPRGCSWWMPDLGCLGRPAACLEPRVSARPTCTVCSGRI
jgi:hypothetical protein